VHKRLLALRQRGEVYEPVSAGVLLDLPPADVAPAISQPVRALADDHAAVAAASNHYAGAYLAEVTAEQERQVTIVERALQQSISDNLAELQLPL
jgi:hypothetical protein